MRETLHQLSVALALPIAVVAVWVVRGEPARIPAPEGATAYRVELAALPLPTRERLRAPGGAIDWRAPRVMGEEPAPRRRRPTLPSPSASPPVDLAAAAVSETAVAAPLSPRAGDEAPAAVPRAPLPALGGALALLPAAPSAASLRPATPAFSVAATDTATPSAVPALTTTAGAAIKAPAETSPRISVAPEPAPASLQRSSTTPRVAALEAADAPAPSSIFSRNSSPVISRRPVSVFNWANGWRAASPIVTGRAAIDDSPYQTFGRSNGRAPLTPPGPLKDWAVDLSLKPDSPEASTPQIDLPLPALESAEAPTSTAQEDEELSSLGPVFRWDASWPTTLVMIPEPGSALLLGAALAALGAVRRGRRRA